MKITGKCEKGSDGFTYVYSNNRIYTICASGWGCITVGQRTATGHLLTQEIYNQWESSCTDCGTFELED